MAPTPLPSARTSLDAHRDRRYDLTEKGLRLAAIAQRSRGEFTDAVADELIAAHPYFRGLLEALDRAPIVCPVPTESDVARGRGGPDGWAAWASELMGEGADPAVIGRIVREHLDRRFAGRTGENRPSSKAIVEALTDAFAVAGFAAHGLQTDGLTIKTLQRWGIELLLHDQSRYVSGYPSANVMWSACDLQAAGEGVQRARRRGRADHGERVARALIEAYRDQEEAGTGIALPVHRIRAQAAFEARVTRALADLVLPCRPDQMARGLADHLGEVGLLIAAPPPYETGGGIPAPARVVDRGCPVCRADLWMLTHEQLGAFLAAAWKVLRPGGVLALITTARHENNRLIDPAPRLIRQSQGLGFRYAQHVIALRVPIEGDRLMVQAGPADLAELRDSRSRALPPAAAVHADVCLLQKPGGEAR